MVQHMVYMDPCGNTDNEHPHRHQLLQDLVVISSSNLGLDIIIALHGNAGLSNLDGPRSNVVPERSNLASCS